MSTKRYVASMAMEAIGRLCDADPNSQQTKDGLVLAAAAHIFGFRLDARAREALAGALRHADHDWLAEAVEMPQQPAMDLMEQ